MSFNTSPSRLAALDATHDATDDRLPPLTTCPCGGKLFHRTDDRARACVHAECLNCRSVWRELPAAPPAHRKGARR